MKKWIVFFFSFLGIAEAGWATPQGCLSQTQLKSYFGQYALQAEWVRLGHTQNWHQTRNIPHPPEVSALSIEADGMATGILGWHEGASVCVREKNKQLWVTLEKNQGGSGREKGPFIRVGRDENFSDHYFYQVFKETCYRSQDKERWCFKKGQIVVDQKHYSATLLVDTFEGPDYGSPVSVEGEAVLWVFVPFQGGFKVYRGQYDSDTELSERGQPKTAPWKILKKE